MLWQATADHLDWPEDTFFGYSGSDNYNAIFKAIQEKVGIRSYYLDYFSHLMCAYKDGEIVFLAGSEAGNAGLPVWACIEVFYRDGVRSPELTAAELYADYV
jgi:hypothetical protein